MGNIPAALRTAVRDRIGADLERYLEGRPRDMGPEMRDPNEQAIEAYRLVPRLMAGLAGTDPATDWMGTRITAPVIVGAFAADVILDAAGVLPIARAAEQLGLPIVISEECLTPLSDIAEANSRVGLQLRGAGELDRALALASHAAGVGVRGIIMTALAAAHPRPGLFPGGFDIQSETKARGLKTIAHRADGREVHALPGWNWETLSAFCRGAGAMGLPVHLKGVLHPDDALAAHAAGCDGIIVSNLGVRNLFRWQPAVEALFGIAGVIGGRCTVTLDGGVRTGPDAVVAACLGADTVSMVRPIVYRAIAGGEAAVYDFLSTFIEDIDTVCFWMGARGFGDLLPSHIVKL